MYEEDKITINVVKRVSPAVVSVVIAKMLPKIKGIAFGGPGEDSPIGGNPFNFLPHQDRADIIPPEALQNTEKEKVRVGGGSGFIVGSNGIILAIRHGVFDTDAEYIIITNEEKEYP